MWKITSTLLLAFCLQAALAQDRQRSIWEDPVRFATKSTKDNCYMSVTGQGDLTYLRILCRGLVRSYWCEYRGKPNVCRNYNNNPRHYYKQIMWDLRKLQNACQGQSIIKPLMCRRASDEAQMVFTSSSWTDATPNDRPSRLNFARPEQMKPHQSRPNQKQTQTQFPAFRSQPARTSFRKKMTPKPTVPKPADPVPTSEAKRIAQYYCWRSFQGVCSYFVGWFKN